MSVSGPLLPGHGTTPEAMNRCRWTDWTGHVEAALADLRARCTRVFVGGLSMGSLLTLHLAAKFSDLPGAIVYSPAVWTATSKIYLTPLARHFVAVQPKSADSDLMDPQADRQLWCYDVDPVGAAAELLKLILDVRRSLPKVVCPVIIFHSTRDAAIHPGSAQRTFERIGAPDEQVITLHESGHCITVDRQWEYVAERAYDFIVGRGG